MTTENSLPNSEGPVESSRIGLRELGQNVSRVLSRVKNGESLVVTEHGRSRGEPGMRSFCPRLCR